MNNNKRVKINNIVNVALVPCKDEFKNKNDIWYDWKSLKRIQLEASMEIKAFAAFKNISYSQAIQEIYCNCN